MGLGFRIVFDVVFLNLLHIKTIDFQSSRRTRIIRILVIVCHYDILQALVAQIEIHHCLISFIGAVPVILGLWAVVVIWDDTTIASCVMHRRVYVYEWVAENLILILSRRERISTLTS